MLADYIQEWLVNYNKLCQEKGTEYFMPCPGGDLMVESAIIGVIATQMKKRAKNEKAWK